MARQHQQLGCGVKARSGCGVQGLEGTGKAMAGSGVEGNPALASSAELSQILHRLLCVLIMHKSWKKSQRGENNEPTNALHAVSDLPCSRDKEYAGFAVGEGACFIPAADDAYLLDIACAT